MCTNYVFIFSGHDILRPSRWQWICCTHLVHLPNNTYDAFSAHTMQKHEGVAVEGTDSPVHHIYSLGSGDAQHCQVRGVQRPSVICSESGAVRMHDVFVGCAAVHLKTGMFIVHNNSTLGHLIHME
jgi:hypothetical protein